MVSVKSNLSSVDNSPEEIWNNWLEAISDNRNSDEMDLIKRAGMTAMQAHHGQFRVSGECYFFHVLTVTDILNDLRMDHETLAAALLHDVVEDTDLTLEDIEKSFGHHVAHLVDGVTKMSRIHEYQEQVDPSIIAQKDHQAENLRKLLLAMVEDVRVVLIKLADRLHNMRTLGFLSEVKQKRIAQETADIYAPLANRLGIWQIKWELEDLAFRYVQPRTYKKVAKLLDERRVDREQYLDEFIDVLNKKLAESHINATVNGRPKHIYSIWRKMKRKRVDFHQIFDVRAVRVLVDSLSDCYAALGIVHTYWKHIHGEFDDYIATPKDNMYQSIHTAIIGPKGRTVEIQIRTDDMHHHAELGVAAHWRYKEGTKKDDEFERRIAWMRQLLEWKEESSDAGDFIDRFKAEVYEDRIYVLTPKGQIIDLPSGASVLDFAYYIHTDVGHRCKGAKLNSNIIPLTHILKNGDLVEILTSKIALPSRDWLSPYLGYLNTPRARAKLKAWFRKQDYGQNVITGKATVEREMHRLGVHNISYDVMSEKFKYKKVSDFQAAVGRSEISNLQIASTIEDITVPKNKPVEDELVKIKAPSNRQDSGQIKVQGVGELLTIFSKCCKPVPYDSIIGYITRGRGVSIHRTDCSNIASFEEDECERLIDVNWSLDDNATYPVDIVVRAYDRQGLLRDVSALLTNESVNLISVNTLTNRKTQIADMHITLEITDIKQLSRILDKIGHMPSVLDATRKT
ncbi:MAG: GTP diphosphokinase [Methylococcales bacterium]|jgi:GTP pyrophosphokinase|nr:GTP diphosphokinase [Methylococcales bacterium]MBT7410267.1 GTP diphosphokinase [Methylococcales bacterium]